MLLPNTQLVVVINSTCRDTGVPSKVICTVESDPETAIRIAIEENERQPDEPFIRDVEIWAATPGKRISLLELGKIPDGESPMIFRISDYHGKRRVIVNPIFRQFVPESAFKDREPTAT